MHPEPLCTGKPDPDASLRAGYRLRFQQENGCLLDDAQVTT
jgi:hypothetical protein